MKRKPSRRKVACGVDPLVTWFACYSAGEGFTVSELCKRAGVAPATVSHWLDGTRQPTIGNLRAAVNALGFELALKRRK